MNSSNYIIYVTTKKGDSFAYRNNDTTVFSTDKLHEAVRKTYDLWGTSEFSKVLLSKQLTIITTELELTK